MDTSGVVRRLLLRQLSKALHSRILVDHEDDERAGAPLL